MTQTVDRPTDRATEPAELLDTRTFEDLGLPDDFVAELRRQGILEPFPIQTMAIPDALSGRDLCGKARTGSGKTLAFGLPMVDRSLKGSPGYPTALVLVPTRELAAQVVNALRPFAALRNRRIEAIYGGTSLRKNASDLAQGVDLVVATPGRLNDLIERGDISVYDVSILVIDEADQMADMGFLPQVARIVDQIAAERQTMLFSATLDGEVDQLIRRYQHDPVFHEVESPTETIETMAHRFIGVNASDKAEVAAAIASGPERTVFFVRTQRGADRLGMQLERMGVRCGVLHGGHSQTRRENVLRTFALKPGAVMVATDVAARGIHIDDIDIVVHFDPPSDHKAYLHRSGRTARAGASGIVVTFVLPDQADEVEDLKARVGLREAIVPMDPDDQRLADLEGWLPPLEEPGSRPVRASAPSRSRGGRSRSPRPGVAASQERRPREDRPARAERQPRGERPIDGPESGAARPASAPHRERAAAVHALGAEPAPGPGESTARSRNRRRRGPRPEGAETTGSRTVSPVVADAKPPQTVQREAPSARSAEPQKRSWIRRIIG